MLIFLLLIHLLNSFPLSDAAAMANPCSLAGECASSEDDGSWIKGDSPN